MPLQPTRGYSGFRKCLVFEKTWLLQSARHKPRAAELYVGLDKTLMMYNYNVYIKKGGSK